MNNALAFTTVLLVWSTTPFFIAQASLHSTPLFAGMSRIALAALLCVIILYLSGKRLDIRIFYQKYLYAGLGMFITLGLVYVSAQFVPSGIIAIIFALTPLITGMFAVLYKVDTFSTWQILSSIGGLIGAFIIFFTEEVSYSWYLLLLLFAMSFQAWISVKLKSITLSISALQTTTGGLLFSLPLFTLGFLFFETTIPPLDQQFITATIYLAILGSIFGFIAYYYLIDNARIFLVAIIPLITPVFAIVLGVYFAGEHISLLQYLGSGIVLLSAIGYELFSRKS